MLMPKTFYDKYYADQPSVTKGIINVIVVAGAAYIGWEVYQSYKKKKDEEQAAAAATQAIRELQELAAQGIKPTYSASQFESWSQALVQAMTGCGTDESAILGVFQHLRNDADIRQLIAVFGVRYYQPCAWTSPVSYARWQIDDQAFGGGLADWLAYDLSSGYIDDINNILAGNGITYSF